MICKRVKPDEEHEVNNVISKVKLKLDLVQVNQGLNTGKALKTLSQISTLLQQLEIRLSEKSHDQ